MVELKEFKVTQRDGQILRLLLEGCSNKEIASELKISPRTVKQHLRSLFQRAGIDGGRKRVNLATDLRHMQEQAHTAGLVRPSAALSALIEHDSEHNFPPRQNLDGKIQLQGGNSGADLASSGSAQKISGSQDANPETADFLNPNSVCAQYNAHGCFAALLASGKKRAAIKNATGFRGFQMRNRIAESRATGSWLMLQDADAPVQTGAAETPTRLTRPLFSRA